MCSKQRIVNQQLWTKNLDILPALSLNEYLFFEIGFEQGL
jgi:hypothetical protein